MANNFESFSRDTTMPIQKNDVVSLQYEMYDADNQLIDKTEQAISYLHGGYDGIFPLVEEALHDKNVGDVVDVTLTPDDAFGEQDEELIRIEELDAFPVEIEVGMMFEADDPESDDVLIYRVTEIADGKAVVDANHPLAGMRIRFKATVTDIRPATHEEVEHGHAHGEHDHHHWVNTGPQLAACKSLTHPFWCFRTGFYFEIQNIHPNKISFFGTISFKYRNQDKPLQAC